MVKVSSARLRFASLSRIRARLRNGARFRARSNSHPVAVRGGCTNFPLATGRAQEDETILELGVSGHAMQSVRRPGSARTDRVLTDCGIVGKISSGGVFFDAAQDGAFDHDAGAHILPQRHQELSRERHDRRLLEAAAIVLDPFVEPAGQRRVRLMAQP
jgi:hypothetical protein